MSQTIADHATIERKARRIYIKSLMRPDGLQRNLDQRYVAEALTRLNCRHKDHRYRNLYETGAFQALGRVTPSLPDWLEPKGIYRPHRNHPGMRRVFHAGLHDTKEWMELSPVERAEIDGDGSYCGECGSFIPSGENTRSHIETCSIGHDTLNA